MERLSNIFKKQKTGELLLGILFAVYLIMGYPTPEPLANLVDTVVGKIFIFMIIIALFMYANPILAVLSLFVAFDLVRRSSIITGIDSLKKYMPTEEKKMSQFTAFNQFPYTLEQEVVSKMAPILQTGATLVKSSYTPLLEKLHDASPI